MRDYASKYPGLRDFPQALDWLHYRSNIQDDPKTIDAYAAGIADYLAHLREDNIHPLSANRDSSAKWIKSMAEREFSRGQRQSKEYVGLSDSTIRVRKSAVAQMYDHFIEDGLLDRNPIPRKLRRWGQGGYSESQQSRKRPPWIPSEREFERILDVVRQQPLRNRTMFATAYDSGTRRNELSGMRLGHVDHATRSIFIPADSAKRGKPRTVHFSTTTAHLLVAYQNTLPLTVSNNEPFWLSESDRNYGQPVTPSTWYKVVEAIRNAADCPQFHPHTLRHLCLTVV